ncbi:Beta-ketoacyl synthase [Metarhizium guizhouense ARSEF 977]|uniref:Beta-ketoacyl synthase n=1 Tax=Metarhizium guizhouense (strain ARSEF 977) TaxID=1276136 RepID=A0A0B4GG52_METGA|nr:Beta-ketoacyl synthase [Metarhizium guizhouense ARSEF 977]
MSSTSQAPIAIVGYSYRAPGVGRKGLWDFLAKAKSAWSRVPTDRFAQDAFHHADADKCGCFSSQGAHFLPDDIYKFDAPFFNLRADEASAVDPQHRMLLECALEAAENAGLCLADLAGANMGVFSAVGASEYAQQMAEDLPSATRWAATGTAGCMFANRLSYFFNLVGPSIAVDAACASSSYAVHLACQSLRAGECSAAFVGAATLLIGPGHWVMLDKMGALSPEGKSFSYDAKASGFGRGEGAACLVLKRLRDALENGDPIHAVIRNSACSHSGRSEGITMPSRDAQERLLRQVHAEIGFRPADTPVVEGHGTGTQAGDPIEAGAFATVLASERTPADPIYIGSLKSNFGHLEGASGILAIIKAVLMIQHGYILPNAHFEKFNVNIEGAEKLRVSQKTIPWPRNAPRRVCVTNFGFGGSNAVLILDQVSYDASPAAEELTYSTREPHDGKTTYSTEKINLLPCTNKRNETNRTGYTNRCKNPKGPECSNGYLNGASDPTLLATSHGIATTRHAKFHSNLRLFILSAKSENSAQSYLASFIEYLATATESTGYANDLAYTLGQRRTHYPYRIAVASDSISGLKTQLETANPVKMRDHTIAFVFTGQGAQYAQMACGLKHYPDFAATLDRAEATLKEMGATWSLTNELEKPQSESRINNAEISQPACTSIQLALVALLQSWGIAPSVVAGHSSGEIAAAFTAGLLSFQAAIAVAYFRGQAATQLAKTGAQKGAMLALGVEVDKAEELLGKTASGYATVAAINSPRSVTLSGDEAAIESIHKLADELGIFARRLQVDVAYHSNYMTSVSTSYLASIEPFFSGNKVPDKGSISQGITFISSVSGAALDAIDASYWVKNLLQPVMFADAVTDMLSGLTNGDHTGQLDARSLAVVIEIGPHSALQNPVKQTFEVLKNNKKAQLSYCPSLVRGAGAEKALLSLAKCLFTVGSSIKLCAINQLSKHNAHVLTNLPAYSWNNLTRYLHKSRIVHDKLHPGQPYDSLLGWKSPHGVGSDHLFRQVLTLDQAPWVRDHNVGGQVIFPMTGFLSMAIEAARRVSPAMPSSILVREFHIKHSLEIREEERVDISTKLRPAMTGSDSFSSTAWEFEIASWTEQHGWTAHCHGQVETEERSMTADTPVFKSSLPLIHNKRLKETTAMHFYDEHVQGGTLYGPTFQATARSWEGPGWTVLENKLREVDLSRPCPYGSLISVDPPTLDGFLQGFGPLLEAGARGSGQMPNFVRQLRMSNQIPTEEGLRFTVVTQLVDQDTKTGTLRISVAVFARHRDSLMPVAEWKCVRLRSIGSFDGGDDSAGLPLSCYIDLLPSLDFANSDGIGKMIEIDPVDEEELSQRQKTNRAALTYMARALNETVGDELSRLPPHLSKFVTWATGLVRGESGLLDDDQSLLLAEVASFGAQGELVCALGEKLVSVLRGEVQPLEIMLKDGLLTRTYEDDRNNRRASRALARCARRIADQNSQLQLRILEIGAGTGSATLPVLEELWPQGNGSQGCFSYMFTDISAGFFENASKKLANWSQYITYKKLDITQDPRQQGFKTQDYDLVIASNVLHATADITVTIDNVRSLLRPCGKLLLLEGIRHAPATLPFAVLPGWWYAVDEYRSHEEGPLLSDDAWEGLLLAQGFSGVDCCVKDNATAADHHTSVICSTRKSVSDEEAFPSLTICGHFLEDQEQEFANMVATQVASKLGCECVVKPFLELDDDDSVCIFIDSPDNSILKDVSSETFESLQRALLETKSLLWVVPENHIPEALSMKGIINSLRLETDSRNFFWFEQSPLTPQGASAIAKLASQLLDYKAGNGMDQDFVWHNEMLHVPRFRQVEAAKEVFGTEAGMSVRRIQKLGSGEEALEMTMDVAGSPSSIYFRRTGTLQKPLDKDEVLVRVEATGMNFRDVLLVLGSIPWTQPGFEGVGRVMRTGAGVSTIKPGDRIYYWSYGGAFASHIRVAEWQACQVPDNISSADAATIPIAYQTASVALNSIAHLQAGESVLIHAASGAVGQACIVLAQTLGARIYATAGTEEKRNFVHETYGIPKAQIYSSRTIEFKDAIMNDTNGRGVDVIVNSLSGNLLQESWTLMADFGRFIELGKKDVLQNSHLAMRPFDRNATFSGVDLRTYMKQRPDEQKQALLYLTDLLKRNVIVPIRPVTSLPVSELASGLRRLQSGKNIGKIVITMGHEDLVLAECSSHLRPLSAPPLLSPDATYIITGGTGGIGLSLGPWMVENGARSVVLLGRSGDSRADVKKVLQKYAKAGTDVQMRAISCDVGSRAELQRALDSIQDLPRVRGVVHGALFLRDALFVKANYEDWNNITRPRAQGAWNLHDLLPDLDFFVILSSLLGDTGNIGQAIYAGTATFFDAFARYRMARGLHAVSISLPLVLGVGYAVERNLTEQLQTSLGASLGETHLQTLIKGAIIGPSSGLNFNGKAASFLPGNRSDTCSRPWQCFNPRDLIKMIHARRDASKANGTRHGSGGDGGCSRSGALHDVASGDGFKVLLTALMDKVSAITMIDRDEVEADAPLVKYSLDSLVSVELRNWIRRETGVDIALPKIVRAANLRALATDISSQQK